MNKVSILKVAGIAAAAWFFVCEPVPQEAIAKARTALDKAEKAGAEIYAPRMLKAGQAYYDSALKELSVENRKLPFKRKYKKTFEFLDVATMGGLYALDSVEAAKGLMRSKSDSLLTLSKDLADSVDGVLKEAAAKKKNVGNLQTALDSARMAQKEAFAALNSGDLFLAEEKAILASNKTAEVAKSTAGLLPPPKKSAGKRK